MGATIDERIVEMKFDNKEFETNVKQSLSTLEKLKLALKFDKGYEDSLNEISKATKNVSFDGMNSAIEEVKSKFSALEVIGVTALVNITNQVMRTGQQMIKSLSTDQITAGFDKYAQKTQSVQTIVNATGKSMEYVTEVLEKLNLYTDETSYNFTDMVNNIGKFTANNIPLEQAESAMEGIANWAAVSGANATEASRAMYNISQAISAGSMKLIDWKSIQNANMATAEFKQTAIETAAAMGTLKANADGTYQTIKGNIVTVKKFDSTLSDAWFTSDVMLATLGKYGDAVGKVMELMDATGMTMTESLSALNRYKAGTLDLTQVEVAEKHSLEEVKGLFDELSSSTYELGLKSLKAAQEAKTFQEAIDATKDAVSTGWMKTFELIFGNYEEAKALWTGLANLLYEIFAESGNVRNELLTGWRTKGEEGIDGRKDLLDAFANSLMAVYKILVPIKQAWSEVFPSMTVKRLKDITHNLAEFTSHLGISEQTSNDLYISFKGLFWIIKQVTNIIGTVIKTILPPAIAGIRIIVLIMVKLTATVAEVARTIKNSIDPIQLLSRVLEVAKNAAYLLAAGLIILATKIINVAKAIRKMPLLAPIFEAANKALKIVIGLLSKIPKINLSTIPEMFKKMRNSFSEFSDRVKNSKVVQVAFGTIGLAIDKLGPKFTSLIDFAKKIGIAMTDLGRTFVEGFKTGSFTDFISMVIEKLTTVKDKISEFIQNTGLYQALFGDDGVDFKKIKDDFSNIIDTITEFARSIGPAKIAAIAMSVAFLGLAGSISKFTNTASDTLMGIKGFFGTLTKAVKNVGSKSQWLMNLAIVIGTLAVSLKMLSDIPYEQLSGAAEVLGKLAIGLVLLTGVLNLISGAAGKKFGIKEATNSFGNIAGILLSLSGATIILVSAMKILEGTDITGIFQKVAAIGIIMLELGAVTTIFGNLAPEFKFGSIMILLVAVAVKQVVSALAELDSLNLDLIDKNLITLLAIMAALGIFAKGIGSIGIVSAVGVFLLISMMDEIVPRLEKLATADFGSLGNKIEEMLLSFTGIISSLANIFADSARQKVKIQKFIMDNPLIVGLVGFLGVVGTASVLITALGKGIKSMGVGMIAMAAALYLASFTFEQFNKMNISDEAFGKAMGFMEAFMGLITIYTAVAGALNKVKKGGKRANLTAPIIAMGLFFAEMAGIMALLGKMVKGNDDRTLWGAVGMMAALTAMITVILTATAAAKDVKVGTIASLMIGLTFIFAEIAVFSALGWDSMKEGILAAAIVVGLLAVLIRVAGDAAKKAENTSGLWKPLAAFIGVIAAIGGSIFVISKFGGSIDKILSAAGGITAVLIAIGVMMKLILKQVTTEKMVDRFIGIAKGLVRASAAIAVVAASVTLLSALGGDIPRMLVSFAAIGLLFMALAGTMHLLLKQITTEKMVDRFIGIAGGLVLASVSMLAIGFAVSRLATYDWQSLVAAAGSIGGLFIVLSASIGILTKVIGDDVFKAIGVSAALIIAAYSMIEVAQAIATLSTLPLTEMIASAVTLTIVFGLMSGLMIGLTAVVAAFGGIGIGAVLAVGVALVALGAAMALAGVAMIAAATGIQIGIDALEDLVTFIRDGLPPEMAVTVADSLGKLAGGITEIAKAGIWMIPGAVGLGLGGIAFIALSLGLKALQEVAEGGTLTQIASDLMTLKESSDGMVLAGISYGIAAVGIIALAGGLALLSMVDILPLAASVAMLSISIEGMAKAGILLILGAVGLAAAGLALPLFSAGITVLGGALKIANPELDYFVTTCGRVATGVSNLVSKAVAAFKKLIDGITKVINTFKKFGQDAAGALTGGVASNASKIVKSGASMASSFVNAFRDVTGWHSPPQFLVDFCNATGNTALLEGWDKLETSGKNAANKFLSGFGGNAVSGVAGIFNGIKNALGGTGDVLGGTSGMFDLLGISLEDVNDKVNELTGGLLDGTDAIDGYGTSAGAAGKESGPLAGLADTIKGAISVFEEFDRTVDISAEQMIANLDDQLNGMIEWKNGLLNLVEKGISPELYEYLANMGQKEGYGYVMALQNASQEQIADLNSKWAQYLTMPQATANEISAGYAAAGKQIGSEAGQKIVDEMSNTLASDETAKTLSDAIGTSTEEAGVDAAGGVGKGAVSEAGQAALKENISGFGDNVEDAVRDELDSHSPAEKMVPVGEDVAGGVGKGITDNIALSSLRRAFLSLSSSAVANANEAFKSSGFLNAGRQVSAGIATGIRNGRSQVINAIADLARETIEEAYSKFEIESPSKVMIRMAKYIPMGIAEGITRYSSYAMTAMDDLTADTTSAFSESISSASRHLADGMGDFNPVITPELDLSNIEAGSKTLADIFNQGYATSLAISNSRMFSSRELAAVNAASNNDANNQNAGNTYTFIQNNNSPEALSRIDIYRSTKNQFAQFREAVESA